MFTKIGVTAATGALPVLLWAGAAGAQQSQSELTDPSQSQATDCVAGSQSQSQSQCTVPTVATTLPVTTSVGGNLARTGAEDMWPLALGGVALAGAVAVRGVRRRTSA